MKLWKFLTTDIRELDLKQTEGVTKAGADTAKAVFDLAKVVSEQGGKVEALHEYVGQVSSLLDVLNSPIAQIVKDTIPFAPLAIGILKVIAEVTKREPTLEQCVALVSQTAYLESTRSLLQPYIQVLEQRTQAQASEKIANQLKQLGQKEFSSKDAKDALLRFPYSNLAQQFNEILIARLQEAGFSKAQSAVLTDRVAWSTHRFVNEALAKNVETLKPLVEIYRNGGREALERYQSVEKYLDKQVYPLPDQVIFQEEAAGPTDLSVTYRELYVPLKAKPLSRDGKEMSFAKIQDSFHLYSASFRPETAQKIELEAWIKQILQDPSKAKHLIFVQGEAGRGKSVFCRMFADKVGRLLYPSYTPILIRLRGLKSLANRLQDTLESSPELQNCDFVTSDPGWLTDENTRFLFLLDGFDELLLEERATGGLQDFLQQVEQFQQNSAHRFVITGRPLALLQVEKLISQTRNIERFELQAMDNSLMNVWVKNWAAKVGKEETQNFCQFLKACPKDVQMLAREPLLMYLLARMHREQQLSVKLFAEAKGIGAKIRIYDAAIEWVLEKQRHNENFRLTGLEPTELRQFLTEAATCVVQSGNEIAKVSMLDARLKASHNPAAELLEKSRQKTSLSDSKALNNLLASFYLKPASGEQGGCIEFVHKSFGEFLFAERLLETLESWSKPGASRNEKFLIDDAKMHQELYDLLGYGGLTLDIVSYLTPQLEKLAVGSLVSLFQRLNDFYERWCEGEFTNAAAPNLPQQTMCLLKESGSQSTGQRQVDVYTGLNVLILLLEIYRHAQTKEELKDVIVFYINDQLSEEADEYAQKDRLLKIIHYSDSIALSTFSYIASVFLYSVNLRGAKLTRANLENAKLENADLTEVNFTGTNLISANLGEAKLTKANLRGANLYNVNLTSADLTSASLIEANLTKANLGNANLTETNFRGANLGGANFRGANLRGANLENAKLENANLENANLTSADLEYANLENANLTSANLTSVNLISVNLYRARLTSTDLTSADLISTYLISANLESANLASANLTSANLESANLASANLTSANLESTSLISANLASADLTNANLTDANLKTITWSRDTKTDGIRGLETAKNVPEGFKRQVETGVQ